MITTLRVVYMLTSVIAIDNNELSNPTMAAAVPSPALPEFPIMCRDEWGAKPPKNPPEPMEEVPVPFVLIHHTYMPGYCNTTDTCKESMRGMQAFHQEDRGWNDIGYSFCIGGKGVTMEGRGWDARGAHAPGFNQRSIGICLIGDFRSVLPDTEMLEAVHGLITYGIQIGKISSNYTLMGHRQVRDTECPGDALFNLIRDWPHWGVPPAKKPNA